MSWMMSAATESMRAFFIRVGSFLPTFFGVIVILFAGWVVAAILQKLLVRALRPWLDSLAEKYWIAGILKKGEVRYTLSELLGLFLYWVVILATLIAALDSLGLTESAQLLEKVLNYVPNVLAGVVVLGLGFFFGAIVGSLVQTAAANAGVIQAKGLGQIARVVVIIFTSVVALEKFFSSMIVQTTFTIVLAAVSLAFALAFGLGCKEIAGKSIEEFFDRIQRR